jgi:hypothetical protein
MQFISYAHIYKQGFSDAYVTQTNQNPYNHELETNKHNEYNKGFNEGMYVHYK